MQRQRRGRQVKKPNAACLFFGVLTIIVLGLPGGEAFARFAPLGPVFKVNTSSASNFALPQILPLADGGFVVTWQGSTDVRFAGDVYGRRFDDHALPVGDEFLLMGIPAGRLSTSLGESLVMTSRNDPVFMLIKFGPDGVLQSTNVIREAGAIAATAEDELGVAWIEVDSRFVRLQRFDSELNPTGPSFVVAEPDSSNSYPTFPQIASGPNGGFVVVWHAEDSRALKVSISELVAAVNHALNGCPSTPNGESGSWSWAPEPDDQPATDGTLSGE